MATASELLQLRGLLEELECQSTQGCPHLSCSVSMLQGQISSAQVKRPRESNKLLCCTKADKEVTMHFPSFEGTIAIWSDLGFLALTDAA